MVRLQRRVRPVAQAVCVREVIKVVAADSLRVLHRRTIA